MPIRGLHFKDIPPLPIGYVECDDHVNLFIGPNSSGKSTILRTIDVCLSKAVYEHGEYEDEEGNVFLNHLKYGASIAVSHDWAPKNPNFFPAARDLQPPAFYLPATRVNLPPPGISQQTIDRSGAFGVYDLEQHDSPLYNPHLYYGNTESHPAFIDPERIDAKSVFYGNRVEQSLAAARHWEANYAHRSEQFLKVIRLAYSCVKRICGEVIYGDVPYPFIEIGWDDANSSPERIVHLDMGIVTTDNILGEPLYTGALSSGTQGTLLWVLALALHMAHRYEMREGWQEKPAILLIDEIENHLHPTWQRRVIPALLDHFPNLQIFATTHSPFVVAGLKAGQVHLLNRDANGVVTATTNTEDIIGWTADQILRTMMGVDEPTDQDTANRLNRLRHLREKETLTPEEESELNELRRRENADLLSKSDSPLLSENDPLLKAQRERYSDLMQSFLLSRQSDLSQDGA
ncbi:MAG: ATP-binding protein [Chloroflexi bacterium]|nr:ATP-binding protein [Chloroflexota bacterium]MYE40677.1 ATP-binding protein [Chloroflexota bacterium]